MSHAEEIERIAQECRRREQILVDELAEFNAHIANRSRELAERSAQQMREFWDEYGEELEKAKAEAEEKERLEAEAREQREAIARAAAARKANQFVAPVDDEDEDDAYYRRKSWLE
ncbi:DNA repair exonuclease SbcCD ATPase subunit [Nocardia transvalensis]|uniref:DNA repair exonuclease SbcCD ATPase subunit n=1 Tax=Nocardia transvalensis TaxID=37333 RepID=A0A7W9PEK8_9NOCA|nr:hypothetical protein [Nocardia transvalensis]MBB5914677.1 DNA repair exonuclease SbcCD ATPase subunit [Nocardia transvalensis]